MADPDDRSLRIPIFEESATIDKVRVQTDAVRIRTSVEERDVSVEEVLTQGALKIERFKLDREIEVAPPVREDGNVTIISLVEERLVAEKRLFVVEEIHITREVVQERVAIPVTLRAMRATIERPKDL
ncbi:YsnF/AvaK domain-containing protein [uncultured Sphingomonas sp.]|uniref:YsnF/AvaK domain-containing protein n=1 Tax=uncultured Sphingomonas sp. TaxID=158754 RepID=UPI0035CA905A